MPLSIPGVGVLLTRENFAVAVKNFVDNLETTLSATTTTANNAQTTANAKYTKPATGIPLADLSTSVQNSLAGGQVGTLNNPQTNAAAARTTGLPFMVWNTATAPTNKIAGDFNIHPDAV